MRRESRTRWVLLLIALGLLGLFILLIQSFAVAPTASITVTRMWVIKRRIVQFARTNGAPPPSLASVPLKPGFDNSLTDAWGNSISYSVDAEGVVTLKSLGSDGRSGGFGDAADLVGRFPTRTSEGAWADEMNDWADDPADSIVSR